MKMFDQLLSNLNDNKEEKSQGINFGNPVSESKITQSKPLKNYASNMSNLSIGFFEIKNNVSVKSNG